MGMLQVLWWALVFASLFWGIVYSGRKKVTIREAIQVFSFGAIAVPASVAVLLVIQQFLPFPERNLTTIITLERVGLGGSFVIISYAILSAGIGLVLGVAIKRPE